MARLKYENNSVIHSKLYKLWSSIINRCAHRPDYAGRGITICSVWRDSFIVFRSWCEQNGYRDGLQIDRINNNLGYSPQNCRFVTAKQNCLNRTTTRNFNGKSSEDVAATMGLTRQAIGYRVRVIGMSLDAASSIPKTPNGIARKRGIGKWVE